MNDNIEAIYSNERLGTECMTIKQLVHGSSVGAVPSGGGHAAEVVTPVAAVVGVGAAEEHRHAGRESAERGNHTRKE